MAWINSINLKYTMLASYVFLNVGFAIAEPTTYYSREEFSSPGSYQIKEDNVVIDRSVRTNPYPNTPSYAQGGDTSRYSTSQGWSRGSGYSSYWGGGRSSDIPTTGYNTPGSYRGSTYSGYNTPRNNGYNYSGYYPSYYGGYGYSGYNTPYHSDCGD